MRLPIVAATAAIAVSLTAFALVPSQAEAQIFGRKAATPASPLDPSVNKANQAPSDPTSAGTGGMGSSVPNPNRPILGNGEEVPAPEILENAKPIVPLPTGALEPYMLTKDNGPFMVLAYSFRGPDAPRQALALVLELRNKYKLPAYLLLPRKFPGRSNIRGVPPQAPAFATRDDVGLPELIRTLDEAAVLVGDEKTVKDSTDLLQKVKKLHPDCIDGVPEMWHFRKGTGLSRATRTSNPFVPAEKLFPRPKDPMLGEMNSGKHTIASCPGRYTLPIASFSGRSTFDPQNDPRFKGLASMKRSPLLTAHEDAERLAESLSRDKEIQKTGFQPYVYHDRFSSRVMIGSFNSPNDPGAQKLHDRLIEIAVDLNNRRVTENMIVPAPVLLDLSPIKPQLQQAGQVRAN